MPVLAWIVAATVAGGVLSVVAAAAFAFNARAAQVPVLISYAVGALLGAVFLEILPHAFAPDHAASNSSPRSFCSASCRSSCSRSWCCGGTATTSNARRTRQQPTQHDHGRSGMMIMIGDTFHNFVDGILIAAAFLADVQLGHGDRDRDHRARSAAGSRRFPGAAAFRLQQAQRACCSTCCPAWRWSSAACSPISRCNPLQQWIPGLLALAAASMLYVSVADLIPGLHRRPELHATLQQVVLIAAGIATIWGVGALLH